MIIKIVTKERKKAVKVKVADQKRKEKNVYKRKNHRNRKRLLRQKAELSEIHDNLGSHLLGGIQEVLSTHFPDLEKELNNLPDPRCKESYSMASIVFAGIMLYGLKQESRHQMNECRKCKKFKRNYERTFKLKLPHMDTVATVLEFLAPELLEKITIRLIKSLLKKGIFHRFRLLKKYYTIAVDATGYASYEQKPNWSCPYRVYTSKKENVADKIVWIQPILSAKLVFSNGFCVQLLTEWVINDEQYDKQDCELKAFKRLAEKLKSYFPRLSICILADGLYTNNTFFEICKEKKWAFITVFKDKQLKEIQEEIGCFEQLYAKNKISKSIAISNINGYNQNFRWANKLQYRQEILSWCELKEEEYKIKKSEKHITKTTKFVFLSNLPIDRKTVEDIVRGGRLRCLPQSTPKSRGNLGGKIENEGFNCQKNGGYKLKHKICRNNFKALQNFMHCLQIAHLIEQLLTLSEQFEKQVKKFFSIKHCYKRLIAFLLEGDFNTKADFKWILKYP
jgi:hypothetical protein